MKKLLLACCFAIVALFASAQPFKAYCEMTVYQGGSPMALVYTFDFGAQTNSSMLLYNGNGKPVKFLTVIDGINYMAKRGWEVKSAYYDAGTKTKHYILEKTVSTSKNITEGLILKPVNVKVPVR